MTLHIAVDSINEIDTLKVCNQLSEYLSKNKKKYNCKIVDYVNNTEVIHILNNYNLSSHETALLMAFDRSYTYFTMNWDEYDIILWNKSILSCYLYNTDKNTPLFFIKQINRYSPRMDLHILLKTNNESDEKTDNLIVNNKTITIFYDENNLEKTMKHIIKLIYEKLPTCAWCGKLFKPNSNHKKYCCKKCSVESNREHCRENNRNYYNRYKNVMSERQKGGLGSKGANLHGRPDPNPIAELQKVRNAKKAVGLKPIQ